MKNILIQIRTSIKFLILVSIATFIIVSMVAIVYKPIYSVSLNGELIGYCKQKSKLQAEIDNYIENGEENAQNVAFVQVEEMPTYSLCLLKRGITTNDNEIYEKVKQTGIVYYKYYAIMKDKEEKYYVSNFRTAEQIVQELKDKESNNIDNIEIQEKYETELKSFSEVEEIVANLYEEKPKIITAVAKNTASSSKKFSTSTSISKSTVSLGISLIRPVTGTITSRFGSVSSVRSSAHTGLDISAPIGTSVKAAAGGTVSWAGYKGSYGYMVVLTHANGVQTYYAHCSKLYVSAGQNVSQGETIAAVGSTGNSTGPHLHLEVRVNGVAYNPQNYLY